MDKVVSRQSVSLFSLLIHHSLVHCHCICVIVFYGHLGANLKRPGKIVILGDWS